MYVYMCAKYAYMYIHNLNEVGDESDLYLFIADARC